jgi:hypothetical protein
MRHHFGDLLDRDDGYWTVVPNRERFAYRISDVPPGSPEISVATIGKADEAWERVFTLPNLEELTLHEPTQEQLVAAARLNRLRRLRVTHARPKDIDFIGGMSAVEELVLEYVSGFDDLSPLKALPRLRALHIENLRRVANFGGLGGCDALRYLAIYGTLDWKQPIQDFEFLRRLPKLEVLSMWQVINKTPYPALLPIVALASLRKLRVHGSYLATEEYALMEEALSGVEGASWGPYRTWAARQIEVPPDDLRSKLPEEVILSNHPDVVLCYDGRRMIADPTSLWFEATGKGAGRVKCNTPSAAEWCKEHASRYAAMRERARSVLASRPR